MPMFEYTARNPSGQIQKGQLDVASKDDVNAYLRKITGRDVTAKDFRTWMGTMIAAEALREMGAAPSKRDAERNVLAAIDRTAERLGNTRAVCRKYYIHPVLIEAYLSGVVLPPAVQSEWTEREATGPCLRRHEAEVLEFLNARLEAGASEESGS